MTKVKFDIIETAGPPLDDFILLLEQVGEWLWQKGIKQWAPGSFRKNRARLERRIENGCLVLAYCDERLAGGCILSTLNPCWPNPSDEAMYLGSLAVARFAAGQGLGVEIVNVCGEEVHKRGRRLLRLDCWDGNSFLKGYYQQQGFEMLGAVPVGDYFCRLFEKKVSPPGL